MMSFTIGWLINRGVCLETPLTGKVVVNAKHDQHLCFMGLKFDPVDERGTGAIHRNLHLYDIYHDLPMKLSWDKSKFPTNHTKYVFKYILYIYVVCVCVLIYIYCISIYIYVYYLFIYRYR
jgi:hypothetical protein